MDFIRLTVQEVKVIINMLQLLIWSLERKGQKGRRSLTLRWVDEMHALLSAMIVGKNDNDKPN